MIQIQQLIQTSNLHNLISLIKVASAYEGERPPLHVLLLSILFLATLIILLLLSYLTKTQSFHQHFL